MKLSELILELQRWEKTHGNKEVDMDPELGERQSVDNIQITENYVLLEGRFDA